MDRTCVTLKRRENERREEKYDLHAKLDNLIDSINNSTSRQTNLQDTITDKLDNLIQVLTRVNHIIPPITSTANVPVKSTFTNSEINNTKEEMKRLQELSGTFMRSELLSHNTTKNYALTNHHTYFQSFELR